MRVRRRRPVRSCGGAPSAEHVVLLDEVHHLALLAPADGASDGVEAELLLQECPLAEQALVRLVVCTPQRAVEDVEEGVESRSRSLAART